MLNWTKEKLANVADIKMSNVDKKTIETEIPIQLCNYTDVYKNSYIDSNTSTNFMFASCNKNEYDKFVLKSGQVAITKDSEKSNDIGIPTYICDSLDNVVLSYHLALVTPFEDKLDGKFLRYWLDTKQSKSYFENNASGSGQRYFLALDTVKDIPLFLPELKEQQEIANLLFNLDSKIELNNEINKELEAMAKNLYDYWFVQFDFPDLNGKAYKSSDGKMVYNKELKRDIPDGWEVKNLINYAYIKKGTLITAKDANPKGNIKVVSAGVDYSYFHDESNYSENTITISASGANAGYVNFWREPIFACDCTAIRGSNTTETLIILNFLKMRQSYLFQQARGSAQPHVYPKDIESLKFTIPPKKLIEQFSKKILATNEKITNNLKQNKELVKLRDWLLPMLMNGQVKVK